MIIYNIILVIVFWIIVGVILYLIIKHAINNSELTKEVRELRKQLASMLPPSQAQTESDIHFDEVTMEVCPGCETAVLKTEEYCPSCGLRLKNEDGMKGV